MVLFLGQQLHGRTVLLTGGLGGVGSACLEKLLRQTEVGIRQTLRLTVVWMLAREFLQLGKSIQSNRCICALLAGACCSCSQKHARYGRLQLTLQSCIFLAIHTSLATHIKHLSR
jgi:NAD(P)-dependent dehydrogenase (short-subunit alcohol dehydrogenase family)